MSRKAIQSVLWQNICEIYYYYYVEVKLVADVIYMITQSALIAYLTCDAKLWFEKLLAKCVKWKYVSSET